MAARAGPNADSLKISAIFFLWKAHSCSVQVSCKASLCGQALSVSGTVQGSCLDDATSCNELILEPSAIELLLQRGRLAPENSLGASTAHPSGSMPSGPGLEVLLRCVSLDPARAHDRKYIRKQVLSMGSNTCTDPATCEHEAHIPL
jgi:hypothetical protein